MSVRAAIVLSFVILGSLLGGGAYCLHKGLKAVETVAESEEQRYESFQVADQMRQSSDDLTRMARSYIATGDVKFKDAFYQIIRVRSGTAPRPENYHLSYWDKAIVGDQIPKEKGEVSSLEGLMKDTGFSESEFAKINEAKEKSEALVRLDELAIHAAEGMFADESGAFTIKRAPDKAMAETVLYGKQYHEQKAKIVESVNEFFTLLDRRTANDVMEARESQDHYLGLVWILVWVVTVAAIGLTIMVRLISLKAYSVSRILEEGK